MGNKWLPFVVVALVGACASEDSPTGEFEERCVTGNGAGIVALGELTISGTADIHSGDVFANGDVTLSGTVNLAGDAVAGGQVDNAGPPVAVSGFELENEPTISYPAPYSDAMAAELSNDNALVGAYIVSDEFQLSGTTTATMPAGTYYFDQGFTMSGDSTLTVTGDAIVYVDSQVSISGNTTINGAGRLELISISNDNVNISGVTDAVMHIVAPLSDVSLSGTADFEGSILGNIVTLSGTNGFTSAGDATNYDGTCSGLPGLPPQPE